MKSRKTLSYHLHAYLLLLECEITDRGIDVGDDVFVADVCRAEHDKLVRVRDALAVALDTVIDCGCGDFEL